MSLLLDALKRAEQEKHSRNGERPPPRNDPGLAAANSPSGALELQPVAAPGGNAAAAARSESAAHAAQVVFQAKVAREDEAANRSMIWATVGVIVVVVAAAGAYVWYSLRTLTPQLVAAAAQVRPPPAPIAAPASGMTVGELPASPAPAPAATLALAPPPAQEPRAAEAPRQARPAPPAAALARELLREAPAPAAAPVTLARARETSRVPREIAAGYEALRSGDLGAARASYGAALAHDSRSLDANLGMATVEARRGNRPAAAAHYRRALEVDPRNATALAGLAALAEYGRGDGLEARLREDIARNPGSAALHLALGNLLAAQSRWHDAQAEYFEAHRLEPALADIAFNLAVSLDHLGQGRLAAEHYRRALEAARSQAVQFDAAEVERRLAQLGGR